MWDVLFYHKIHMGNKNLLKHILNLKWKKLSEMRLFLPDEEAALALYGATGGKVEDPHRSAEMTLPCCG